MTPDNIFEIEDISLDDSDFNVDVSIGNEPVDMMIEEPGETREERKKRLDLICRNVIDGVIDVNHLMISEMLAVFLRLQEMVDELDLQIIQATQESCEQTTEIQQLQDENKKLKSYLQQVGKQ